jgi:uncharacterized protein YjbJ (UPF0337 family)
MMNWTLISEHWNHLAPRLKSQWDKLTHEDLAEIDGDQEALTAKLQARYGFHRMDAERKVAEWGGELTPELERSARGARPERVSRSDRAARGTDAVKPLGERDRSDAARPAGERDRSEAARPAGEHERSDAEGEELPDADPRFKVAEEERPESPTSKLTPPVDRRNESRDRPAGRSSSDNVI